MRIAIFGASGSVGRYLVPAALDRGHEVVPVTRRAARIGDHRQGLRVIESQLDDAAAMDRALVGVDAVIVTLGDAVVDTGTDAVLAAMQRTGVSRIEVLTGFGTSAASRRTLPPPMRAAVAAVRAVTFQGFVAKERQDAAVRRSNLLFTIVQPPSLTDGPRSGMYRSGDYAGKSIFGSISRGDLADFMLDNLDHDRFVNESTFIQS